MSTGQRVIAGRYVLRELLGAGGMGIVHLAKDLQGRRDVAIKLLHDQHAGDRLAIRHLRAEGLAGSRVHHPNVVAVLDAGTAEDGMPYVVMENVRGRLLGSLLQTEGPISLRRATGIVRQLLAGLHAIHEAGLVHGDIKSDNIMVESLDDFDFVKIIDLGLVRVSRDESPSGQGMASGTPEYMAPEVIRGEGTVPASDIYAAGVIFYELLTGTTPFSGGTSAEVFARHLHDEVVPPSLRCPDRNVPIALERAVMFALEKEPAARYATASAFGEAIAAATPVVEPPAAREARPVFSTVAPTRDWNPQDRPSRGYPSGTRPPDAGSAKDLRGELAGAIADHAAERVVRASLALARRLVIEHHLHEATTELERAMVALVEAPDHVETWPVLLTLAALYDGIREPIRARATARVALQQAIRSHSSVGRERAAALIARFKGKSPKMQIAT